jgi:hypothetical protein
MTTNMTSLGLPKQGDALVSRHSRHAPIILVDHVPIIITQLMMAVQGGAFLSTLRRRPLFGRRRFCPLGHAVNAVRENWLLRVAGVTEERTMQYHDRDDDWRRLLFGFLGAAPVGGIAAVLLLAADTSGIL